MTKWRPSVTTGQEPINDFHLHCHVADQQCLSQFCFLFLTENFLILLLNQDRQDTSRVHLDLQKNQPQNYLHVNSLSVGMGAGVGTHFKGHIPSKYDQIFSI